MIKILQKILRYFAKKIIEKRHPIIIGITGSVGKTTTKDTVYAVLESKFHKNVAKSKGNLNTEIGLPLAILGFDVVPMGLKWLGAIFMIFWKGIFLQYSKNYPKILVLEYGADKPGDINYLIGIARPDYAIVTSIGPAHLEQFGTIAKVREEKIGLAKEMNADGVAILNEDNEEVVKAAKNLFHDKVWYHGNGLEGSKNAAKEIAKLFKLGEDDIDEILNRSLKAKGRLSILDGINDSIIIDDSYNSNPLSVNLAIEALKNIKGKNKSIGRTIVVLGDMLELGSESIKLHKEVAIKAKRYASILILVGNRFSDNKCDKWFLSPIEAGKYLENNVKKNDLILVKGSQGMRMEKTIEPILKEKDKTRNLLVRQTTEWRGKPFIQP